MKQLLQRETAHFITPDVWPHNSPDLNTVDYRICGVLQVERVYPKSDKNWMLINWKWLLIEAWFGIQQSVTDQAIDQWRVCLAACVKAKGKHFEDMLWCAVPQLSIIYYETYIQLFIFVSHFLTRHDFSSFSSGCWTIFRTFIEFHTVKNSWSLNVKMLYRFVTNTFR